MAWGGKANNGLWVHRSGLSGLRVVAVGELVDDVGLIFLLGPKGLCQVPGCL